MKRLYLGGIVLEADCPHCSQTVTQDLGSEYLSYPPAGKPFDLYFAHYNEERKEDHEWSEKVILRITVEAV